MKQLWPRFGLDRWRKSAVGRPSAKQAARRKPVPTDFPLKNWVAAYFCAPPAVTLFVSDSIDAAFYAWRVPAFVAVYFSVLGLIFAIGGTASARYCLETISKDEESTEAFVISWGGIGFVGFCGSAWLLGWVFGITRPPLWARLPVSVFFGMFAGAGLASFSGKVWDLYTWLSGRDAEEELVQSSSAMSTRSAAVEEEQRRRARIRQALLRPQPVQEPHRAQPREQHPRPQARPLSGMERFSQFFALHFDPKAPGVPDRVIRESLSRWFKEDFAVKYAEQSYLSILISWRRDVHSDKIHELPLRPKDANAVFIYFDPILKAEIAKEKAKTRTA